MNGKGGGRREKEVEEVEVESRKKREREPAAAAKSANQRNQNKSKLTKNNVTTKPKHLYRKLARGKRRAGVLLGAGGRREEEEKQKVDEKKEEKRKKLTVTLSLFARRSPSRKGKKKAMLSRLGFSLRETGQALDRLGCRLRGSEVYLEESALEIEGGFGFFVLCPALPPSEMLSFSLVCLFLSSLTHRSPSLSKPAP